MAFKLPLFRSSPGIEVVHLNHVLVLAGDQVATMGELDLFALLDVDLLVLVEGVLEYIHKGYVGVEANNEVQPTRV